MTRIADHANSTGVRATAQQQYQRLAPMAKNGARQAKSSAMQAAAVVAPYAESAKDTAVRYAEEARDKLAPKVSHAMEQAKDALPPKIEHAVDTAAKRTRSTVKQATEYAAPRVEHATQAARSTMEPVRDETVARAAAAFAALRGKVTVADIERLARKRARRARNRRFAKRVTVLGVVVGGGYAAWHWWTRQTNPDWLVEEPEATEVIERPNGAVSRTTFDSVDGTGPVAPDPDAQAKQAEAEAEADRARREKGDPPS